MSTLISSRSLTGLYRADLLDALSVLLLLITFAAVLVVTNPFGNFPVVDDWIYAFGVKSLLDTGRFTMPSLSAANVIAQAYWGALFCEPFGFSYEALRVSTAVLAALGITVSYLLFRELGGSRQVAGIGALTVAANPIYIQLTDSFMTDVPFAALVFSSFWLYVRAVLRGGAITMVLAFVAALLALLIRQFAILIPIAFGAAYVARKGFHVKRLLAAALPGIAFVAVHLGYQHWMMATGRTSAFSTRMGEVLRIPPPDALHRMVMYGLQMLPYFGAFCAPFFAYLMLTRRVTLDHRLSNRGFAMLGLLFGTLLFLILLTHDDAMPEFGNHLTVHGLGPLLLSDTWLGTHPVHANLPVVPGAALFWIGMTAIGCWVSACAGLLLAGIVLRALGSLGRPPDLARLWPEVMFLTFLAGYVVVLLLIGGLKYVFDRYLLATIVPLCALLLLSTTCPASRRIGALLPSGALLAVYAVLAVLGTHDYLAWNRARWDAIHALLDQGVAPDQIDAGFEYNGAQTFSSATSTGRQQEADSFEYRIAAAPAPGYGVVRTVAFARWLWPDDYALLVLRRARGEG